MHLAHLEKKIKEKEEELGFLSEDLPSEIKKLKNDLIQKTKQIEDLTANASSSLLQSELTKLKAYIEDLKKLEVTKDVEINKLNDQLKFKDKEIERLNHTIQDSKPIDYIEKEKQLISLHQQETNQLNQKINDLELRIYKLNDDKKQLSLENFKLQEKLTHYNEEEKNKDEEQQQQHQIIKTEESECVPKDTYNNLLDEFEVIKQQLDSSKTELEQLKTFYNDTQTELNSLKAKYNESQTQRSNMQSDYEFTQQKLKDIEIENNRIQRELNDHQSSQKERSTSDENHMKDIKYIKAKHEAELNKKDKEYEELKAENEKSINEYIIKIKELELLNRNLNISLKQVMQGRSDLEEIIIKQEEKVSGLGDKVNKIDQMLKNKNSELKQNESYSIQLINIINDQKKQIANVKNSQRENENSELVLMQDQINTLKVTIEGNLLFIDYIIFILVKDAAIAQIQQKHKLLQEKYSKLSSEKRIKPQEELLKEAKEMKQNKMDRDKERGRNKSSNKVKRSLNNNNNKVISDYSNIDNINNEENKLVPDIIPPRIIPKSKPRSPYIQQLQQQQQLPNIPMPPKYSNSTLPLIPNTNEKPLFNMNSINNLDNAEEEKMDEINNMMRKIIDEF